MASLQERNGSFRLLFMFRGKLHSFTIGKVSADEAQSKADQVEYLLMRLGQGYEHIPLGCDIVTFLKHDGKPPDHIEHEPDAPLTLKVLRQKYLDTHSGGTLEEITLKGIKQHFGHWEKTLSQHFPIRELTLADLQKHVDRRRKMAGVRGTVSPATIKKEIVTLRAVWNWGVAFGLLEGKFPAQGLRYPKADEKPPFLSRAEIERLIANGGDEELWNCLYLTLPEIAELLEHVRQNAAHPFIYPMFALAAHTGARRSELLRAQVADVDLEGQTVQIREKKRVKGKRTLRRVPLSPLLCEVLTAWLEQHPGGPHLFCLHGKVPRSQKKRPAPTPITMDEAHDHFRRTLADSKWSVLPGWHCLRHSFISACASSGTDQRLIDEWVGHTTEEMRRRYRHLYPSTQRQAITSVFGGK
jgi:integrase